MSITAQAPGREKQGKQQKNLNLPRALCLRIKIAAANLGVQENDLVAGVLDAHLPDGRACSSDEPAREQQQG